MRLYFDTCCYGRGSDDRNVPRNVREANAIAGILEIVRRQKATLVTSQAVFIELNEIRDEDRRVSTVAITDVAGVTVAVGQDHRSRAAELCAAGFGPFDALHLACAESAGCDLFVTVDDRILKLGSLAHMAVVDPLTCLLKLEQLT